MANMKFSQKKEKTDTNLPHKHTWKIVIADDDNDVHTLTKSVLKEFTYKNRPLELISTYTAQETLDVIENDEDIALLLLDVVMDTDDAGLLVVKKIRETFNNNLIQIVLRTGQPGFAPQKDVVVNYAINDYKEKTELTAEKLFTTIVTALRSYKTLKNMQGREKGLKKIINASDRLYTNASINTSFISFEVLEKLIKILKLNNAPFFEKNFEAICLKKENEQIQLSYEINSKKIETFEDLNSKTKDIIIQGFSKKDNYFLDNYYIAYNYENDNNTNLICLKSSEPFTETDKAFINIFFNHANVILNNLKLNQEMFSTQKVLIEVLGQVVEKRYVDDPNHIKRVAQMSYLLARKCGINEKEANMLRIVSPMHDVGKIGISDAILLKPGKLTPEEFEQMKTHTTIGYNILKDTKKETLDIASLVAYEHHEKWDGTGYPRGLKGEEISIYGRITSVVDVFDALANKRCYKEVWEKDRIIAFFKKQSGTQFDPTLVKIFLDNYNEFESVQNKY